ncbi:MAG TPA: hypothetical protein VM842_08825 [Nitrospira sp.]|jgi:hypothetical protein|nr:hypothetical protein [Nitrospira sp.]
MMEQRKPQIESVEGLLAEAHRRRPVTAVGEDWTGGIMRVVRQDDTYSSTLAWAAPIVWRAAAGAALVAVVFAGSVVAFTSRQPGPVTAAWLEDFDAGPPLIE